jgi:hypothetical protein
MSPIVDTLFCYLIQERLFLKLNQQVLTLYLLLETDWQYCKLTAVAGCHYRPSKLNL